MKLFIHLLTYTKQSFWVGFSYLSFCTLAYGASPIAVIDTIQTNGAAAKATLSLQDPNQSLSGIRFRYTVETDNGTEVINSETSNPYILLYPLLDTASSENKFVHFYTLSVRAVDATGTPQSSPTTKLFPIFAPDSISLASDQWHMKTPLVSSIPVAGLDATLYKWVDNSTQNNLYGKYLSNSEISSMNRGQGYWIYPNNPIQWELAKEQTLNSDLTLALTYGDLGWNQVGNPFPYTIQVDTNVLHFWKWNPITSDVERAHGFLDPWEAYWVQVSKDTTMTLSKEPFFPSLSGNRSAKVSNSSPYQWRGQLSLQAGTLEDRSNFFGLVQLGEETSQESEPPKIGSHVSLFFTGTGSSSTSSNNRRYATDIRYSSASEEWFQFGVQANETSQYQATLTLDELESLESQGYSVFLVKDGESTPLESGTPADLTLSSQESYYHIVVTEGNTPTTAGPKLLLSQNSPNPIHTYTSFQFTLPGIGVESNQDVKITLWSSQGHYIQTIYEEQLSPGPHSFLWTRPSSLSGGTYIYQISAGSHKARKVLLIMP